MTDPDDQRALQLAGELDDPDAVRAAIADSSDHFTRPLRVDLSAVTYLPSAVIGVLFGARKAAQAAGCELEFAVVDGSFVQRVLLITALPHVVVPG